MQIFTNTDDLFEYKADGDTYSFVKADYDEEINEDQCITYQLILTLIQIALTLDIEVGELFPPLRELKAPYRKRLSNNQ